MAMITKACQDCAVVLMNGDESVYDGHDETLSVVISNMEYVGLVSFVDKVNAGCFDCFYCEEIHYGYTYRFES